MEDIVLVGFGGHGKSVADCIERQGKYHIIGYTDLQSCGGSKYVYLGTDDVLEGIYAKGVRNAIVCLGYLGIGITREKIYDRLKNIGYTLPTIIDPSAIISEGTELGEGTFVGKLAVVNADSMVGKMAIINTKALVEHECTVGDFTHIAIGAVLCGNVSVGEASFVGANATVIQSYRVGDRVVIGAGTIVAKDIENGKSFRNAFEPVLKDN